MPINPAKVQWDNESIDKSQVKWEGAPQQTETISTDTPKEDKPPFAMTRPAWSAVGGTLGAIGGASLGPAGVIGGGGIGAATGSILFDNFQAVKAYLEGKPENIPSAGQVVKAALKEGMIDASFGMGASVVRPVLWSRRALGWMSGVTNQEADIVARQAEKLGVGLGAVDVGGVLPKSYAKTIGVFPWSGTPLRRAEIVKQKQATKAIDNLLDVYAPNATMGDLGVDMVKAAKGTRQEFRNTAKTLYGNVDTAIENASRQDIIPTNATSDLAKKMAESAEQGKIILQDGKELPRAASESVLGYVEKLQQLPELLSPVQYRQLTKDLSDLINKNLKDGFDVKQLTEIKKALELDFGNLRVDLLKPGEGEAIKDALDTANKFYSKGIIDFQTPTAKKFERVDKNIFRAGAETSGTLNADELYRVALNLKSPNAINDLRKLVGTGKMKEIAAFHVDNAKQLASTEVEMMGKPLTIIDPYKLEKELGITKKSGGLAPLLKYADVNLSDVKALIETMKRIQDIKNPAEFVRRKAILQGTKGITQGMFGWGGAVVGSGGVGAAAGGVPGGMITLSSMLFMSRHMSKIFADPIKLKLMKTALDEAVSTTARQAALGRAAKMLLQQETPNPMPETNKLNEMGYQGMGISP